MRFILFICDDPTAEPYLASEDTIEEWVGALEGGGRYVLGDRLRPAEDARTVIVRAGERIVRDGPFTESPERIAGFDVIDADSLDEAVDIAAAHPMARFGRIEVRALWPF